MAWILLSALPSQAQPQFEFIVTNGTVTITKCSGNPTEMAIPSKMNGLLVTGLANMAFYNMSGLTSVKIPFSINYIGGQAFGQDWRLTNVIIPRSVRTINYDAFDHTGLQRVTIPFSVTNIGRAPFAECPGLTNITVEDFNTNYVDVNGVLFNKALTVIVQYPTGRLAKNYVIPNGVTNIAACAFRGSANLTNVVIPDGMVNIGYSAFAFSPNLRSLAIPASVNRIEPYAFGTCKQLEKICFAGDAPSCDNSLFFMGTTGTVYYLRGKKGWTDTFSCWPTVARSP